MATRQNLMLRASHQQLVAEHKEAERILREVLPKQIEDSYSTGGEWHDNPAYDAALERQGQTAKRLEELSGLLANPVFIEDLPIKGDEVRVGVNVILAYPDGSRVAYDILGPADTRYRENTMSCFSPLAQQLLGRKAGERVRCRVPKGEKEILIVEIRKIGFSAASPSAQ